MTKRTIALVSLFAIALPAAARAEDASGHCPAMAGASPELSNVDASARMAFIDATLRDQGERARAWTGAWVTIHSTVGVGGLVLSRMQEGDDRFDSIAGGLASFVPPAVLLVRPIDAIDADERLTLKLAAAPKDDACARLAIAEAIFAHAADDEAEFGGPWAHVLSIGGNAAFGLFLGLGFGHWTNGVVDFVGATVLDEARIYTQPRGAISAMKSYRRGVLAPPPIAATSWSIAPLATPLTSLGTTHGISIVARF